MEEIGAQLVAPEVIHQHLSARLYDSYPMAKKRALPFNSSTFLPPNAAESWNPMSWDWDSARFVAKSMQCDGSQAGGVEEIQPVFPRKKEAQSSASYSRKPISSGEDNANHLLKLGGGKGAHTSGNTDRINLVEPQPVSRPNKRIKSGSPGGTNYPMCQVDNCKEDLSTSKDYHRRHKVCEVHSKAGNALVGNQMQRFCQQCSRFHPLPEFDEVKRSCRRRLAGHNRRRRKTQPEDTTQRLAPCIGDNTVSDNDVINLLAVLTHAQGNTVDGNDKLPLIPCKDQLLQILSKINSLPLPEKLAAKLNCSSPNPVSSENQNQTNNNSFSASTMDLLAGLSATTRETSSDVFETQSQPSTEGSETEKSKSPCLDHAACLNKHSGSLMEFRETSPSLPLQLFRPSLEDYRVTKVPSDRNFLSSGCSYPSEERSPLSWPAVVHDLFPMQTSRDTEKNDHLSNSEGETTYIEAGTINECSSPLQLFAGSNRSTKDVPAHSSPCRAGYASSSGSDHSPSCQNSDAQDRTARVIFKLFDKDPSHMPGSLRTQIYNWLSNSPSEMVVLFSPCIYQCLHLHGIREDSSMQIVESLGYTRTHLGLSRGSCWWTTDHSSIEGRSLTAPGTRIHCTHAAGYNVREINSLLCTKTPYDELILADLKVNVAASGVLGRCFIEVENNLRGSSYPVIIADSTICQELRLLEPEINGTVVMYNSNPTDLVEETVWIRSREEALHFLDELGWLFQRKYNSSLFEIPDYRLSRFKYLLVFSVEHDFCALVKTLLDILLEFNSGRKGLEEESLELLSEIHLLNRAVKRRCRSMVDILIQVSVVIEDDIKQCQVEVDKEGKTKSHLNRGPQSCSSCAAAAYGYSKRIPGSKGMLQRPYIHSVLVVAAVCVCVCLFLRGHPSVGCVTPFSWENLDYGTI